MKTNGEEARNPAPPPEPKKPLGQRFIDWYLGWLGRIFTGKV